MARGHEAVISAVGPGVDFIIGAARVLLESLSQVGVRRLVVVGGAGGLEVPPGMQGCPLRRISSVHRVIVRAHCEALAHYRKSRLLDWSNLSPRRLLNPERAQASSD